MRRRGLPREKVLATVFHLLDITLIRVGNADYAEENDSYGLTTLRNRHAVVQGAQLHFEFKGKSGKTWRLRMRDRRIARMIKDCQELPGQLLFQYLDDDGQRRPVTSADVNAYLREVSGADVTAKDFRTWAGTVLAAMTLADLGLAEAANQVKRNVREAIVKVATRLGNTPAICRASYIHPEIFTCHGEGGLVKALARRVDPDALAAATTTLPSPRRRGLAPEEQAVLTLLRRRLRRTAAVRARRAA
jgi:DNA topoisomerase-1